MRFAYSRQDGGVNVVTCAPKESLEPLLRQYDANGLPLPFTDADYEAHVFERNGVLKSDVLILGDDWVPPDAPRSSWRIVNGQIVADQVEVNAVRVKGIKAEAQRRIMAAVGVTTLEACIIKQLNANMRANELNDIRHDREWTAQEAAEAAALRGVADQIKTIRAKSNVLELNPPSDFTADTHWT